MLARLGWPAERHKVHHGNKVQVDCGNGIRLIRTHERGLRDAEAARVVAREVGGMRLHIKREGA